MHERFAFAFEFIKMNIPVKGKYIQTHQAKKVRQEEEIQEVGSINKNAQYSTNCAFQNQPNNKPTNKRTNKRTNGHIGKVPIQLIDKEGH